MPKKRKKAPVEEGPPDATTDEINNVLLSSKTLPAQKPSYNGAKLTLELLEATTTGVVRRMGWFRDVRLRRAADGFMRGCKIHQQASEREGDTSRPFEKPSHSEIQAYEEELKEHIQTLQSRMKVAPMNDRREIKARLPGAVKPAVAKELARLQELKERAAEREKNPKSVIKGSALQKKRRAGTKVKASAKAQDSDSDGSV